MLQIGNTLISLDILNKKFVCDIIKCKGICCIEGDSGAPLEQKEAEQIRKIVPKIIEDLSVEAKKVINEQGPDTIDADGDLTTSIVGKNGPCVFVRFDNNNCAFCAIERAYEKGAVKVNKPLSCSLYPIRVQNYKEFTAVNYHQWHICKDALIKGSDNNTPVYVFLKSALIRKFGSRWYKELCLAAEGLNSNQYP